MQISRFCRVEKPIKIVSGDETLIVQIFPEKTLGATSDVQMKTRRSNQCCGGRFYTKSTKDTAVSERIATSPGYPLNYEPNSMCIYKFQVSFKDL